GNMGGGGEDFDLITAAVYDREQPAGVGRGVLDVADAGMGGEALDDVERQIRTLELRIGVDHDGNVDGIGNRAEIGFDAAVGQREVGFEDCENPVGAKLLVSLCLPHRI